MEVLRLWDIHRVLIYFKSFFFGPAVNAARAIAVQVEAAVVSFVQNFQTAVRPQIVKSYAMSDILYMHKLIIMSSKYGFFFDAINSFATYIMHKSNIKNVVRKCA